MRVYCLKHYNDGLPTIISRAARTTKYIKYGSERPGYVYIVHGGKWLKVGEDCWMTEAEAQRTLFAYLGKLVTDQQRGVDSLRDSLTTATARLAELEAARAKLELRIASDENTAAGEPE